MIIDVIPSDWRDLQAQLARILEECGLAVEIEKTIETVRGTVSIDVHAEDTTRKPTTLYLCECKHWSSAVPKTVVHAFRTVVSDYGANWGLIISSRGFQEGAPKAASHSNVKLLDWAEFQDLFVDRWIERHMIPRIYEEGDALMEYAEPVNSRIFRKAAALEPELNEQFIALREQYSVLAFFTSRLCFLPTLIESRLPELPMKKGIQPGQSIEGSLPEDLLEAATLRQFLDTLCGHLQTGVAAFDRVFGGRA